MSDDPFKFVWNPTTNANTPCNAYIHSILDGTENIIEDNFQAIRIIDTRKQGTKYSIYRTSFNSSLEPHAVYSIRADTVPEYKRITFTRLGLFSHNLASEKGR